VTAAKVDFSSVRWGSVEWTNLVTLCLRAHESRSRRAILGDHTAAEAVDRIDYDFKRIHRTSLPASNRHLVTLRAKQLDDWCADFLCGTPMRSSCISVAVSTAVGFGSSHRHPCSGSTSLSQLSSSYAAGCTTTPTATG
jgi:hypothetical protein